MHISRRHPVENQDGRHKVALAAFLSLAASFSPLQAQEVTIWDGDFELDVRGEFKGTISDNVTLDDANKQMGYTLAFSPGVNLRYRTGRTQLSVDYFADYYYFLHDKSTELRHNLFGTLNSQVIEDNLAIFARVGIQEEFLDRTGSFSQNEATKSNNRRTVQNYTARSQWTNKIGSFAKFSLNYEFGVVKSPADNLDDPTLTVNFSDTVSHNANATLMSGKMFSRISWDLSANWAMVEKSLVPEPFKDWNVDGTINYEVNRFLKLKFGYGTRGNNARTTKLKLDNGYKIYGLTWQPGPKLNVNLRREQLPQKNYDNISLRYQLTKRLTLTVSHGVDFTSNGLDLAQRLDQINYQQTFGIDDGTGIPVDDSDLSFSLSDVDYESYSWQGSLRLQKRRDEFYISYDRQRRIFDNDDPDSISWGMQCGWKRKITKRETFETNCGYRVNLINGGTRTDKYYTFNTQWQKKLSRYFNLSFQYAHTRRRSTDATGNLTENALVFYLRGTY